MKRKPIVAANWKMNGDLAGLSTLAAEICAGLGKSSTEVVVCPPFPYLSSVTAALCGPVKVGAQDVSPEGPGAHTGDVSAAMLLDLGCRYVIVGHSERRADHGEPDELIARKAAAVLEAGLDAIVCIGETKEQREAGETEAVLERQLNGSLAGLALDPRRIVLAYEPVWAIGTGLTATPEQAQQAHAFIREKLAALGGEETAAGMRIQYGGSVKPNNAAELFGCEDIDGGLIGGAALDADSFAAIVKAAG